MYLTGDIEQNIFKLYPELKMIPEFNTLRKEHGEEKASKYIWAIAKTEDPDSKLYTSKLERRRRLVEENFVKHSVPWEDESVKDAIIAYSRECMSAEKKFVKTWGDKIHEADRWINEQDVETILEKKSYIQNFDYMLEQYEKHKEKYFESQAKSAKTKGGYKPSRRQKRIQALSE